MSNKIDFSKKQKLKKEEITEKEDKGEEQSKDILAPFDYYAHFGLDHSLKEEDQNLQGNENNNIFNNNEKNFNSIINESINENNKNHKKLEEKNINENNNNIIEKTIMISKILLMKKI